MVSMDDPVVHKMLAGGGAGAISRTLTAPMERVKVLLQVQIVSQVPIEQQYKGILDCLIRIPKEQGFLAFWRGNGINVVRMIPNSAIKFTTFDYYKQLAFPKGESSYEGWEKYLRKMVCGGVSGVSTILPVYPMDLARTRLSADSTSRYNGVMHLFRETVKNEGARGLYNGLGVSLCGIIPYLAISLSTYDMLKDLTKNDPFWQHPGGKVLMGSSAAILSQSIAYPMDTVRRHMQVSGALGQKNLYSGGFDCIRKLYSKYGLRGFYRGLLANASRAAPQTGIEFAAFDVIAGLFSEFSRNNKQSREPPFSTKSNYDSRQLTEEEIVQNVLQRRLSSSLPRSELHRVNAVFESLLKKIGKHPELIRREDMRYALMEVGFEEFEVDEVLAMNPGDVYVDFYKFREICQDNHLLNLLEQQYDDM